VTQSTKTCAQATRNGGVIFGTAEGFTPDLKTAAIASAVAQADAARTRARSCFTLRHALDAFIAG